MNNSGNNTHLKGESIYSSLNRESLLEMLESHENAKKAKEDSGHPADKRTENAIVEIQLELSKRAETAKDLVIKYSQLVSQIFAENKELEYLEEKNEKNWSVGTDKQIKEIKDVIGKKELEKGDIEELLQKIGFDTAGNPLKSINVVSKTRQKVHIQLELPL